MNLRDKINQARHTLDQGIQAVSSTDLFPTPPDVARRMVGYLDLPDFAPTVLEPSAGTGRLMDAVYGAKPTAWVIGVERSRPLAIGLRQRYDRADIVEGDFLSIQAGDIGSDFLPDYFDGVLMNPPFSGAQDIAHVEHARRFLTARGTLVAIVADGPRQLKAFQDAEALEMLPAGTFAGTNVRARIIRYRGSQS